MDCLQFVGLQLWSYFSVARESKGILENNILEDDTLHEILSNPIVRCSQDKGLID